MNVQYKKIVSCRWLELLLLSGILGLAAFLRFYRYSQGILLSRDGINYLQSAIQWSSGDKGVDEYFVSLYPQLSWFILVCRKCALPFEQSALFFHIFLGVLLILIIYFLGKVFLSEFQYAGCLCALAGAGHPVLIELSCEIQREMFYLCMVGLNLLLLGIAARGKYKTCCWAGVGFFTAVAFLCRYEALIFLGMPLVFMAVGQANKTIPFRKSLGATIAMLSVFILTWLAFSMLPGTGSYFSKIKGINQRIFRVLRDVGNNNSL